jgi:hypothetical protein
VGVPNAAFTPGPWTSFYKAKYDEWHVAMPYGGGSQMLCPLASDGIEAPDPSQREANARLIAAAPDLYEALDELLNYSGGADHGLDDPYVVERANAALSKARAQ